jgi:type I restriction enzyme R subunit
MLRGGLPGARRGGRVRKWRNFRDEPLAITPHREKMVKRNLEKEFKKAENPFRIAIVCAMWLTGFDVKCLATCTSTSPCRGTR